MTFCHQSRGGIFLPRFFVGAIMDETKKLHLVDGDSFADIESQDKNGETTGNFGDPDSSRALGAAIWNVQHQEWDQAVVTFSQNDTSYEVYVTPVFSKVNGVMVSTQVQLEFTLWESNNPSVYTETVSYDDIMKTSINTKLFG